MSVVGGDSVPSKSHSPGPLAPILILCPPLTPHLPFKSELSPGSQGPFYRVSAALCQPEASLRGSLYCKPHGKHP